MHTPLSTPPTGPVTRRRFPRLSVAAAATPPWIQRAAAAEPTPIRPDRDGMLQTYNPAADIVATDIYPVIPSGIRELYARWPDGRQGDLGNHTLSQVGQYADKMRAVAGPRRAVFMVLQGFAWEDLRESDRDPAKVLYPTAAQPVIQRPAWLDRLRGMASAVLLVSLTVAQGAELWLTHPDGTARFEVQPNGLIAATAPLEGPTIEIDPRTTYQEMDGFGYTLTGGSAQHLLRMSGAARAALLNELFGTNQNAIGVSYLRLSIGASDLSAQVFSYSDLPAGETDPELARFDLGPDRSELIPVLKEILAIDPDLKLLGSPWSAPAWMKTNSDTRGGNLKPEWYAAYARYFVKYIQAMMAEGIRIDAVTVQNEPLHPGNNPSMFMPAEAQAEFIKRHLGPAFKAAGIATKIICYDHNADRPDYPLTILNDPEAKPFVDGSAFHLYAGRIEALGRVHEAHPDKHLYFTEQWIGGPGNLRGDLGWHVRHLIVGATRHWCRTVLEWNLSSNPAYQPHTDRGGCERCLGAVTIDGDRVTRNPGYYIIAHASKFVRPGSVRIASSDLESLPNVGFRTPTGRRVAIVLNPGNQPQTIAVRCEGQRWQATLPAGAVATCVW